MLHLSIGNQKLKPNESTKFLIWNLPADITCPYSTPMCRKYCYAKKAERLYPTVSIARQDNFKESLKAEFIPNMIIKIQSHLCKKSWIDKQVLFRVHESGDFYNYGYFVSWVNIARAFPNVQFLAYTKSICYVRDFINSGEIIPDNFTLRFSVWDDTPYFALSIADEISAPVYTALPKEAYNAIDGRLQCDCKTGCAKCQKCWNKAITPIITAIH